MREREHSLPAITRKSGLSLEYVNGVTRLIEKGEQRLLRSVEARKISLSVAVEIAEAEDHQVQRALQLAYEKVVCADVAACRQAHWRGPAPAWQALEAAYRKSCDWSEDVAGRADPRLQEGRRP